MVVDGEQRFAANIISIQKRLIAFGELLPRPGKALKAGTPIHTLLIHLMPGLTLFELNNQGNTRDTSDIDRVELTPTTLRLVFAAGHGPYSGRVSLSPQLEIFDRDTHSPNQLDSIRVELKATATQLARIKEFLRADKRLKLAMPAEPKAQRVGSKSKPAKKRPVAAKRRRRAPRPKGR